MRSLPTEAALLLVLSASTVALAAESWRAMATSTTNVLFSVDEASLEREGDVVKFWERLVYVMPVRRDEVSGRMVKEKRVQRLMNCALKTQGYLYGSLIGEDGRRIEANSVPPGAVKMTPIPPNTLAAEELAWACAK